MIVLASSSPRRSQLLDMLDIAHEVEPAGVEEAIADGESPAEAAVRLARQKATTVAKRRLGMAVLGADTIVVLEGRIMGKPESVEDAKRMLSELSGRSHQVMTGVALARGEAVAARLDVTTVTFRELASGFIDDYLATGEPLDKAGAYGIQGYGAALVEKIEGDFFGVMGLPVRLVLDLMGEARIHYRFTR